MELGSSVKNSFTEPYVKICFAIICAWTGERELALGQLEALTETPGSHTYGNFRLSPMWDSLPRRPAVRKNRRFSGAEKSMINRHEYTRIRSYKLGVNSCSRVTP